MHDQLAQTDVTVIGGWMAKTKFKLDGVRYRGKLKAADWNKYEARI